MFILSQIHQTTNTNRLEAILIFSYASSINVRFIFLVRDRIVRKGWGIGRINYNVLMALFSLELLFRV